MRAGPLDAEADLAQLGVPSLSLDLSVSTSFQFEAEHTVAMADGSDRSNTRGVVVIALTGLLSTVGAAFLGGAFANSAVHDQLVIVRENTIKDQRRQVYVDYLRATAKACEAAGNGDQKAANAAAIEVLNQQGRVLLIAGPAVRTAVNNFSNKLMETEPAPGDQNPCELAGYRKLRDAFVTAATPEVQE